MAVRLRGSEPPPPFSTHSSLTDALALTPPPNSKGEASARVSYLVVPGSHATAELRCSAPCLCLPALLSTATSSDYTTVKYSAWLGFTRPSDDSDSSSGACRLQLRLLTAPSDGAFKLVGLQVQSDLQ